jgi:hypothetical protein
MLKGYLTYAAGVAFIIVGVYQIVTGDAKGGMEAILAGLAIIGGRRAIADNAIQGLEAVKSLKAEIKGVDCK